MAKRENFELLNSLANLLENNKLEIANVNTEDVLTSLQTNIESVERGIATLKTYAVNETVDYSNITGGVAIYSCYGDPSFSLFGMTIAPALKVGGKNTEILIGFPNILRNYGKYIEELITNSGLLPNVSFVFGTNSFMTQALSSTSIKHCVVFGDKWIYKYVDKFKNNKSLTYYGPGNNTAVLLSEDNLEEAIDKVLESTFILSGQVAVSINRCIIDDRIDKVKVAVLFYDKLMKIKSGKDSNNYVTPIAIPFLVKQIEERIANAENQNAIITNYSFLELKNSSLITPSLVWLHNTNAKIWKEYHFAPVLPIVFLKFNEIAKEVNSTNYGIYTTIWGNDDEIDLIKPEILKEHIMVLKNQSILDVITTEKGYDGAWGGYKDSGFYLSKETNWKRISGSFNLLNTFTK